MGLWSSSLPGVLWRAFCYLGGLVGSRISTLEQCFPTLGTLRSVDSQNSSSLRILKLLKVLKVEKLWVVDRQLWNKASLVDHKEQIMN